MMKTLPVITGLWLCMATTMAMAAGLPANYPQTFIAVGTIDAIDRGDGTIIVGDSRYAMSSAVRVHETSGKSRGLAQRDLGAEVGVSTYGGNSDVVGEIWILPRGYLDKHQPLRR